MPISIDDARDERLTDYVGLTDVALRRRLEPENGLYTVSYTHLTLPTSDLV